MDGAPFREKAAMCLRLIQGLSPNNPGRFHLLELAKAFYWRARELEQTSLSTQTQTRQMLNE
jgi:hypothetical protein